MKCKTIYDRFNRWSEDGSWRRVLEKRCMVTGPLDDQHPATIYKDTERPPDSMHADHPNILFIYCDELRTDALGCYGHPTFRPHTPHLNRLAERGIVFTNNFCNSPLCVPSRTCLLSGAHCEQTGVYANEGVWPGFQPPHESACWIDAFNAAGYRTANFGKTHVRPSLKKWQVDMPAGGGMKELAREVDREGPSAFQPRGVRTMIAGLFPHNEPYPPEKVTDNTLQWLGERDAAPWLCRVSYLQPHTPVYPPPWAVELIENECGLEGGFIPKRGASRFEKRFAEVVDAGNLSEQQIRMAKVYYYALVTWVDREVGRLMDWLEASGQAERTIVVFEADHGAALGEGGRYAKHVFSPEVHRVPRLIAWPGTLDAGVRCDDLTQTLDLAPTLLNLCSVTPDERLRRQLAGRDLFGDPPPKAVISTIGFGQPESLAFPNAGKGRWDEQRGWPRRMCVRTDRYRYDCNVLIDGKPATGDDVDPFLCDWKSDPEEAINLAGQSQTAEVERQLTQCLAHHHAKRVEPVALPSRTRD